MVYSKAFALAGLSCKQYCGSTLQTGGPGLCQLKRHGSTSSSVLVSSLSRPPQWEAEQQLPMACSRAVSTASSCSAMTGSTCIQHAAIGCWMHLAEQAEQSDGQQQPGQPTGSWALPAMSASGARYLPAWMISCVTELQICFALQCCHRSCGKGQQLELKAPSIHAKTMHTCTWQCSGTICLFASHARNFCLSMLSCPAGDHLVQSRDVAHGSRLFRPWQGSRCTVPSCTQDLCSIMGHALQLLTDLSRSLGSLDKHCCTE